MRRSAVLFVVLVSRFGIYSCQALRGAAAHQLDFHESYHVRSHDRGPEVVDWFTNAAQVLPEPALPAGSWPNNLVIGYVGGYTYDILRPLIIGFLVNVKEGALVLLTPSGDVPGLPSRFTKRVIVQKHEMPKQFSEEALPHAVSLRFYVARAFLTQIQHAGKAFICDSRDVFIQKDMFEAFNDDYVHFPRESGGYRIRGPFSLNSNWITQCYGQETLDALGGHYVLNSGTFLGPSKLLLTYIDAMLEELQHRWHCRRLHGTDQAIHNFLVYTGKFIGTGIQFSIEDLEVGKFAHVAWVHSAMLDFRAVSDERAELYNRVGDAFVAIHLWSPDSPVGQQVVLPFIQEFEPMLLGNTSSFDSGRAEFDPRHQTEEEARVDAMLGLESKDVVEATDDASLSAADQQQGSQSDLHAGEQLSNPQVASDQAAVHKEPLPHTRRPHRRNSRRAEISRVGSN